MKAANIFKTPFAMLTAVLAVFGLLASGSAQASPGRVYDSSKAAIADLMAAVKDHNLTELANILGADAKAHIESGDAVLDQADREAFILAYEEKSLLAPYPAEQEAASPGGNKRYLLEVGEHAWPFPVPLIENASGQWFFDAGAGAEAIKERRIGHNELAAIQVCLAYVDAQLEYQNLNPMHETVPHFAGKMVSLPGKRDGLYWKAEKGEQPSPMGKLIVAATVGSSESGVGLPYYGYHYRMLYRQGKYAAAGQLDYMKGGIMSEGFALLAYPAVYGASGVMTFIVNQDGVVYQKNLGKDTAKLAGKIMEFDPDDSWRAVEVF